MVTLIKIEMRTTTLHNNQQLRDKNVIYPINKIRKHLSLEKKIVQCITL